MLLGSFELFDEQYTTQQLFSIVVFHISTYITHRGLLLCFHRREGVAFSMMLGCGLSWTKY